MNRGKKLIIASVILVALIVLSILIAVLIPDENDTQAQTELFSMAIEDVDTLTYTYQGESLSFKYVDSRWVYEADTNFPLNQSYLNAMFNSIASLKSQRLISSDSSTFENYGLDSPQFVIIVTDINGVNTKFNIGIKNEATGEYYLNIAGTEDVHTVLGTVGDSFAYKLYDMINMDSVPEIAPASTTDFSLTNKNGYIHFNYFYGGNENAYTDTYEWFIDEPFSALTPADTTRVETIVYSGLNLELEGCVDYNPTPEKLAQYGLDNPQAVYTLLYDDITTTTDQYGEEVENTVHQRYVINFGNIDTEKGIIYLQISNSDMLFYTNYENVSSILEADANQLLTNDICKISLSTVESMKITAGGNEYDIEISRQDEQDENGETITVSTYKINGSEVDSADFEELYRTITNMYPEGTTDNTNALSGTPYLKIEFSRNTSTFSQMTLEFFSYNSNFYQVRFNGSNTQLVSIRDVEGFVTGISNLA